MTSSLLLLLGGMSVALADTAPSWPEGEAVSVSTHQLLYDEPAKTEAELLRRQGRYGVALWLPQPVEDGKVVQIRVYADGVMVGAIPGDGDPLVYEGEGKGTVDWAFEPVDDAGQVGPKLTASTEYMDPFEAAVGGGSVAVLGGSGDPGELWSLSEGGGGLGGISGVASVDDQVGSSGLGQKATKMPTVTVSMNGVSDGLDKRMHYNVVKRYQGQLRYCVDRASTKESLLSGEVGLELSLSAAGVVSSAQLSSNGTGSEAVATCLVSKSRRWRFPASNGGGTVSIDIDVKVDD